MSNIENRQDLLQKWAAKQLAHPVSLRPLGGDAGARRYFQLPEFPQWLAVDAPPSSENTSQFIYVEQLLRRNGVITPRIFAADTERGLLLVENWGDELFAHRVVCDSASLLYGEALFTLLNMAQIPTESANLPVFDSAFIQRELHLFNEWFVERLLGLTLSDSEQLLLEELFSALEARARAQVQVLMHRDFHSRNLMLKAGQLAVIDFQDALIGPITYDLVSVLRDCYLTIDPMQVRQWALVYANMAIDAGILPATDDSRGFLQDFDWMGLQRHLKVLGVFSRLHLRDNKPHYLADLPRVLAYVQNVAASYPELQAFSHWLTQRIIPACQSANWYSETLDVDIPSE